MPLLGNGGYTVSHHGLELTVDPARNHLSAVVTIEALATQSLTAFNLDFAGPDMDQVLVNEEAVPFCREEGELVVAPVRPMEPGAEFVVSVSYAGSPEPVVRPYSPTVQSLWFPGTRPGQSLLPL